jgi:hypothetical protein
VNFMKFRIVLLAAATMSFGPAAMAQTALTAAKVTPILSGTYIVRVTHVCQVTIAVTQSQSNQGGPTVSNVTAGNSGDANQNIGTVTFDHTTGKVTMAADSIDGSPVLFSFNDGTQLGTPLTDTPPSNPPPTFNYSNDSTSFTVGLESGLSVTYHAFYASLNSSTKNPQFMIFGGIEKPGCTTTGIAIHQ